MGGSMIDWMTAASAMILAVVLVVAAATKVRDQATTASDFSSLGVPAPALAARLVPMAELAVAAALVLVPGWGGVAAFGLLAVFTALLVTVWRSGRVATCACFGGTDRRPIGPSQIGRNFGLLALAVAAAFHSGDLFPG